MDLAKPKDTAAASLDEITLWRPVLHGAVRDRALKVVTAIGESLLDIPSGELNPWQNADLALYYTYLSEVSKNSRHVELALRFLDQAIVGVSSIPMKPCLYDGFTGIAWVLEHLQTRIFNDPEDANTEIDESLLYHLGQSPWHGCYDLISGLVGYGVYLLDRLPRRTAIECLKRIIHHLSEIAEEQLGGFTWRTNPAVLTQQARENHPNGYYNLGIAHGIAGVIAFASQVCASEIGDSKARSLLDGAVSWLLSQKLTAGQDALFSNWVESGSEPESSRSAWCYGDPGVAAALLVAAKNVGEPAWQQEALAIAHYAARRPIESTGVMDASLCHGSAGLGHLFNRMFQATNDVLLRDAAEFWLTHTLNMRRPNEGIAGYLVYDRNEHGDMGWVAEPGFLMGAVGTGLALLSAATSIEPKWDHILLTSIPM